MAAEKLGQRQRIDLLDAFRTIAVLWVAVFHFGYYWTSVGPGAALLPYDAALAWIPLSSVGVLGVSLFFMISGYVIALTLQSTRDLQTFLVKRIARLWPALLVCGTLTFVTTTLIGPPHLQRSLSEALISMLFLPPQHVGLLIGQDGWQWLDGAYWSLWVEVKFYVIIGALYYLFPKRWFEAWLTFAMFAFGVSIVNVHVSSPFADMADGLLFGAHIPFFTIGMAASRYKRGKAGTLDAIAVGAVLTIALFNLFSPNVDQPVTPSLIVGHAVVFGLFAGFVWHADRLAWLERKWMLRVGRASYSFYLLHQVVGISLLVAIGSIAGPGTSLIALPFTVAGLLYVSMLIFEYIERPANKWIVNAYVKHQRPGLSQSLRAFHAKHKALRFMRWFQTKP